MAGCLGLASLIYYVLVDRARALAWEAEEKARRMEADRRAQAEIKL